MKKESFFFLIWTKGNLIFVYDTIEDTGSISQQKLNFEKKGLAYDVKTWKLIRHIKLINLLR